MIHFLLAFASLGSAAVLKRTVDANVEPRLLFQFENNTFIENIAVRDNGHLLLGTFDDARLYSLDPNTAEPTIQLVAKIPDVTGMTGIAEISPDVFAISNGVLVLENYTYAEGTAQITTVDFTQSDEPVLETVAHVPDSSILNGMTALPYSPHVVLSIDSRVGNLYRIDTQTGAVDVVSQHDLLGPGENPILPLGANGIHIHNDDLYFTNSGQQFFGRVKISPNGEPIGEVEKIAHLPANSTGAYDDFAISETGDSYATAHPFSFFKISAAGEQTVLLDESSSVVVRGPTAVALSKDQSKAYIVTAGMPLEDGVFGGQVVEIDI